jgi:hypothetical protein
MYDRPLAAYYLTFLGGSAVLIVCLGRLLHRSGLDFLHDTFPGNQKLARSMAQLLDVGFYMMSMGYVCASFLANGTSDSYVWEFEQGVQRLGWFLLTIGPVHLFNMLLLTLFRRRTGRDNAAPGQP